MIRDWVLPFNAVGPNGLIDRKALGKPRRLNDEQRQSLAPPVRGAGAALVLPRCDIQAIQ